MRYYFLHRKCPSLKLSLLQDIYHILSTNIWNPIESFANFDCRSPVSIGDEYNILYWFKNTFAFNIVAKISRFAFIYTTVSHCEQQLERKYLAADENYSQKGERGGSVVECRTPEREVRGSKPTAAVLCPWARHFTPRKYWLITQEAVAPSRHNWKIVDWDVKPQYKQTKTLTRTWIFYTQVSLY